MKKELRQQYILELISNKKIQTQNELSDELNALGVDSTQATISRDIKELNIIKVQNNDGSSSYTVLNDDKYSIGSKIHEIFKLSVQSISKSESGIVIKTIGRTAGICARYIEHLNIRQIVGILFSDDTVLLELEEGTKKDLIIDQLRNEF